MNIYLRALEIGSERLETGIKYSEIKKEVNKVAKRPISGYAEINFIIWFLDHFSDGVEAKNLFKTSGYIEALKCHCLNRKSYGGGAYKIFLTNFLEKNKYFINGRGSKQYLEYKELKEARESSKKALKKANISIWIAIGTLLISIIFSWLTYNKPEPFNPAPPYDVKLNQPIKLDDESINKIRVLLNKKDSIR